MSELKIGSGPGIHFRVRVVRILSEIRVRTFGQCPDPNCLASNVWAMNHLGRELLGEVLHSCLLRSFPLNSQNPTCPCLPPRPSLPRSVLHGFPLNSQNPRLSAHKPQQRAAHIKHSPLCSFFYRSADSVLASVPLNSQTLKPTNPNLLTGQFQRAAHDRRSNSRLSAQRPATLPLAALLTTSVGTR